MTTQHDDGMSPEELKLIFERRDILRQALREQRIPHIEIAMVDDTPDAYTPIVETALTFEMLINSLLGNYSMANNQNSLALLFYITGALHNLSHLSADLLMDWLKQHLDLFGGTNPLENILKMLDRTDSFVTEHDDTSHTEVPEAFKNALKEIMDDNDNVNG